MEGALAEVSAPMTEELIGKKGTGKGIHRGALKQPCG
jgi:hypothetical protein